MCERSRHWLVRAPAISPPPRRPRFRERFDEKAASQTSVSHGEGNSLEKREPGRSWPRFRLGDFREDWRAGGVRWFWWREPRPQDGVFDAVDEFVNDEEAGWAAGVFAEHPKFGFGFVAGAEQGSEFGFRGSWVDGAGCGGGMELAELLEDTEGALERAFGGGSVAEEEVVFLQIRGSNWWARGLPGSIHGSPG